MNEKNNNTILILTYAFPPAAYVGVYRTLKYCKYLGNHGWRAIVVTPDTKIAKKYENLELLNEIPSETYVSRTFDIDPIKWFQNTNNWFLLKVRTVISILCKVTCLFDNHIFWVPFAYLKCRKLIKDNKIDLIYSSSPPHSAHLVSLLLKKFLKVMYVVDFRDPWGEGSGNGYTKANTIKTKIEGYLIRQVIENSEKVITITKGEAQEVRDMYSSIPYDKVVNIENGFDPDDYICNDPSHDIKDISDKYIISYLGSVYEGTANEFMQGLSILKQKNINVYNSVIVRFIGSQKEYIKKLAKKYNVSEIIEFLDYMPHKKSLTALSYSDVLLILLGGDAFPSSEIPAKTFEYLYANKPILAIAKEGDLSEILENSNLGVVVNPGKPGLVADEIEKLFNMKSYNINNYVCDFEYINNFRRDNLTEKLVNVLNGICKK